MESVAPTILYSIIASAFSGAIPTRHPLTLSSFEFIVQTRQSPSTEHRIETLEPSADPIAAARQFIDASYLSLLDSALMMHGLSRYSYITADPFLVVRSRGSRVEIIQQGRVERLDANPFDVLKRLLAQYSAERRGDGPSFQGGAVGYVGYEMARHLERLPTAAHADLALPDMSLGFYDWVAAFDHARSTASLVTTKFSPNGRSDWVRSRLEARRRPRPTRAVVAQNIKSNFSRRRYIEAVNRVKRYIVDGDIYQANISQRFQADVNTTPWNLYQALRKITPAPYSAYLQFPEMSVISCSPELFLRAEDGVVQTRPMKGTRPRGATAEEDDRLFRDLAASEKDRAENIMIVDLLRNDLGKVCIPGTICVPEIFTVEKYPKVHQLVSSATGRLRPEHNAIDLLTACFPGGSVTGAPKIRAMEIIDEIEPVQRSVYCGAIGYIGFDGSMQMSIPIRTALMNGRRVYIQVGGGIVADSDPDAEYRETLDKASGAFDALGITGFQS